MEYELHNSNKDFLIAKQFDMKEEVSFKMGCGHFHFILNIIQILTFSVFGTLS